MTTVRQKYGPPYELEDGGDAAWKALIVRYAEGRRPCNCRQAYREDDGSIYGFCPGGCSSNQIQAKEELARRIILELRPV